jgi:polyisoprenoid-binding protein YceI
MKTITPIDARARLSEGAKSKLVNVLSPDSGEVCEGSTTVSVYEMAFVDKITELTPETADTIILFDSGEEFDQAAVTAAGKLEQSGYRNVLVLEGGLRGWRAAGLPVEGQPVPPVKPDDGRYAVDTSASIVRWTGRNIANHHEGTLSLSSGFIDVKAGKLQRAEFEIDMNSIKCLDLEDSKFNSLLIAHLKDGDFFAVGRYPTAKFTCDDATLHESGKNVRLAGALTLRGKTEPVELDASVGVAGPGKIAGQAFVAIDRTRWGVLYGSEKFFSRLGMHLVSDEIQLHIKIVATL